ncbi:MAG: 1-deoxy-D-xylulose-5-phosphate synthase, partial [Cocleimonas sp.]
AKMQQIDTVTCIELGKATQVRKGSTTALLVFGTLLNVALEVADELDCSVINMRFIKPIDTAMIIKMASSHSNLVTIEDSAIVGGAGSAVLEVLNENRLSTPCLRLGLSDTFPSHGTREQVFEEYGLDKLSIVNSIRNFTSL